MIKNIFYVLTILLSGVAGYFGYSTKGKLEKVVADYTEVYDQNQTLAKNIESEEERKTAGEVSKKSAIAARDETQASLENETGKNKTLQESLGVINTEIEAVDGDLQEIELAITEAKNTISEILGKPVEDLDVDQVVTLIEQLKNERKQKEEHLDEKTQMAARLASSIERNESEKNRMQERLSNFRERIALNSVSISVSSAENDYGFVVLNRGSKNSNINERSQLIVTRGGEFIGKLKVASLEPNQTIADIVPGSIKTGKRIMAGDRVTISQAASN